MSDERFSYSYRDDTKYITLRQYIKRVMEDQPSRKDDLNDLIKVFGAEAIEAVIERNFEVKIELLWNSK